MEGAIARMIPPRLDQGPRTWIVLYSMPYSEEILQRLPHVRHYFERVLSHLVGPRPAGTRVVLVTPEPVDPEIIDYHLNDLRGPFGSLSRDQLLQLSPESRTARPLAEIVLGDPGLLNCLEHEVHEGNATLLNYAPSEGTDLLAQRLEIPAEEGPLPFARRWGTKSGSRAIFSESGVCSPRGGTSVLTTIEDVTEAALELASGSSAAKRVLVKLNDLSWADGVGNALVDCARLLDTKDISRCFERLALPWSLFQREISRTGAAVEEFVEEASCTPSGQGFVDPAGKAIVLSTHDQILHDGHFLGCSFPASPQFRARVHDAVLRVGQTLAGKGARGSFGVDFVGTPSNGLFATEINLRKVGPSHAVRCVGALVDPRASPGVAAVAGRPIAYVHRRFIQPSALKGLEPRAVIERLRRSGLLFDHATMRGGILHILGALREHGYVETTMVAATEQEAAELDRHMISTLVPGASPEDVSAPAL